MPVEFLSDDQASAYGRFPSGFTRAELERYFFLDDVDQALIEPKRRDHNKLGFAATTFSTEYVGGDVPLAALDLLVRIDPLVEFADIARGVGSASIVRTAYPRFKRVVSARELAEAFTPTPAEGSGRAVSRSLVSSTGEF